ncbi:MAG TPA: glycosyltransferase family 39 protein [Kofleriaceae bacterium]|nr:glycosyltransferase family 39 protein [Kofleriaceae bacterium]
MKRALLGFAAVQWLASLAVQVCASRPLGYDEAQYADAARDWLAGRASQLFYLSPGMNPIAAIGIALGGGERAMRVVPALLALVLAFAVWQLARRTSDELTATWTVSLLATARQFSQHGADLLSDLPAATCLIAATFVIAGELAREDGPRWRFVVVAPLAALAIYLRYGSCIPLAVLGVSALALGLRSFSRRPAPVVVAVLGFAALLVPHAVTAMRLTGSPLGILVAGSTVPYGGVGLVTYVTANPSAYYGWLLPPVLVAGIVAIGWVRDRGRALLWMTAIGDIAFVGLVTHARARYIVFGLVLLAILGVDLVRHAIATRSPRVQRAFGACALATLAAVSIRNGPATVRAARYADRSAAPTLAAGAAIRADAADSPCIVFGYHDSELEWHTHCVTVLVLDPAELARKRVYVVRDAIPNREEPDLDAFPGKHALVLDEPDVRVIRLDP